MDVVLLETESYYPTDLVERYRSMIWTERFNGSGDFQLTTSDKDYTRQLIPEGSLIGLMDSLQVMQVQNHDLDAEGNLVVRGESVDSFFKHRALPAGYGILPENAPYYTQGVLPPYMVALMLMWNSVVDNTPILLDVNPAHTPVNGSSKDLLPHIHVWTDLDPFDTFLGERIYGFSPSNVHTEVWKILNEVQLGLKTIRPQRDILNGPRYTFSSGGGFVGSATATDEHLRFEVYKGLDRTIGNDDALAPITFSYAAGHFVDPANLWAIKNNIAYVLSNVGGGQQVAPAGGTEPEGWERRVQMVDSGITDATYASENAYWKGVQELLEQGPSHLFEAQVAQTNPYIYGTDYGLGDLIQIVGDTGEQDVMRVTEYIRTQDQEGERGFPTLVRPDWRIY